MQIQITGHSVEITPALKEYVDTKFTKLKRFTDHISNIHVILNVNKLQQMAEAQIKLHGSELHAKSDAESMYAAIDLLIDKLHRQLTKHKEKHDKHRQ
jgi:putative sigma-54 modulation protein